MVEVLDWQKAVDPYQVVSRAVEALAAGDLVAFPTETVYGIAANPFIPEAVERLVHCKGRPDGKPLALAIRGAAEALEWVPGMSLLGRRLARRCWPGPVTLVFGDGLENGPFAQLPESVQKRVCPGGTLGFRTPAHNAILEALEQLRGPLVLTSANRSGEAEVVTADEIQKALGEQIAIAIDDGPCRYGKPSTVVQVNGPSWKVLREGVVPASALERLSGCLILFICTGNTCRSPMAEGLCKKLLADRLHCTPDELPQKGYIVASAGLAAASGGSAAPEACQVAGALGADLSDHSSQPLTPTLVAQADYLIAMTEQHLEIVREHFAGLGPKPRLLCPDGKDVPDPIGREEQVYRECAQQILLCLEKFLEEVHQP